MTSTSSDVPRTLLECAPRARVRLRGVLLLLLGLLSSGCAPTRTEHDLSGDPKLDYKATKYDALVGTWQATASDGRHPFLETWAARRRGIMEGQRWSSSGQGVVVTEKLSMAFTGERGIVYASSPAGEQKGTMVLHSRPSGEDSLLFVNSDGNWVKYTRIGPTGFVLTVSRKEHEVERAESFQLHRP